MEKYDANGKVVFIEPRWITGETCLFTVTNKIQHAYAKGKLSKMRKEFVEKLENEGFIITDNKNYNEEDVITFVMNNNAITENEDIAYFKKEFDKVIFDLGGEKLNFPKTLTMKEYLEKPFFPAVMKNEIMNGGYDKFLIETEEQLEIIKKFYNEYDDQELFDCTVFQQFIETPTNYKTYMRVLMSSSGEVMGASLKYSEAYTKAREPKGTYEQHFWNPNSKYFMECKGMFNYYSGGGNIYFPQPKYSTMSKRILAAHNIDPENPTIPEEVLEVSKNIAIKGNKTLGVICGIDFIYNEKDNKWYYLEIQAFPAIDEWAVTKGIKIPKIKSVDDYIKLLELELIPRHEALINHAKMLDKKYEEVPKKYELKQQGDN